MQINAEEELRSITKFYHKTLKMNMSHGIFIDVVLHLAQGYLV